MTHFCENCANFSRFRKKFAQFFEIKEETYGKATYSISMKLLLIKFSRSTYDGSLIFKLYFTLSFVVEATCKAQGDPHYTTFDGKRYDFMGKCKYILAKDFVNNTFEIMQENEPCGNGPPTCTKSLTVIFTNSTFIQLRRGMTIVNGAEVTLPVNYPGIYRKLLIIFTLS